MTTATAFSRSVACSSPPICSPPTLSDLGLEHVRSVLLAEHVQAEVWRLAFGRSTDRLEQATSLFAFSLRGHRSVQPRNQVLALRNLDRGTLERLHAHRFRTTAEVL